MQNLYQAQNARLPSYTSFGAFRHALSVRAANEGCGNGTANASPTTSICHRFRAHYTKTILTCKPRKWTHRGAFSPSLVAEKKSNIFALLNCGSINSWANIQNTISNPWVGRRGAFLCNHSSKNRLYLSEMQVVLQGNTATLLYSLFLACFVPRKYTSRVALDTRGRSHPRVSRTWHMMRKIGISVLCPSSYEGVRDKWGAHPAIWSSKWRGRDFSWLLKCKTG